MVTPEETCGAAKQLLPGRVIDANRMNHIDFTQLRSKVAGVVGAAI